MEKVPRQKNLFTFQYPSNWTPSGVLEPVGPIDILVSSPGSDQDSGAEVEFIQWNDPSVFRTAQEALEAEINSLQNDPTLTKFEIERPVECSRYTLNGIQACSIIYEIRGPEGTFAALGVDSLAANGTEYEAYYKAEFDSFEYFLPTAEYIIESFRTTGTQAPANDFSLSAGSREARLNGGSSQAYCNPDNDDPNPDAYCALYKSGYFAGWNAAGILYGDQQNR